MNKHADQKSAGGSMRPWLTRHAIQRCLERRVSAEAVQAVLEHGRVLYCRHAKIYFIGRKEITRFGTAGADLRPYEGVHVVCDSRTGAVLTTYRDRSLSGLRKIRRTPKWWLPATLRRPAA